MFHQLTNEHWVWHFVNASGCSSNCFWMTSSYSLTSKHTLPNFGCVLTNAMNLVLAWIWRSACCWFTQGSILGYMVSKVGKLLDPKKNSIIVNMPTLKMPKNIHVFNGMAPFYWCFIKNFAFIMAPSRNFYTKQRCLHGLLNVRKHGRP